MGVAEDLVNSSVDAVVDMLCCSTQRRAEDSGVSECAMAEAARKPTDPHIALMMTSRCRREMCIDPPLGELPKTR
jgi:hypothetical protein